jgi:hypothetical protein
MPSDPTAFLYQRMRDYCIGLGMPRSSVVFGEAHLRRVLGAYATYYNKTRPHLALRKDAPLRRTVQRSAV